ncbi:MAG: AAA family ATPase [Chloroflexota bacterium]
MYEQLEIAGFRGIRDLRIENLRRVNLFVGTNNVGKTSLLEAAWLLRAPGNPSLLLNIAQSRGINLLTLPGVRTITPNLLWTPLFYGNGGKRETIRLGATESGVTEELIIRAGNGTRSVVLNGRDLGQTTAPSDLTHSSRPALLVSETLEYIYQKGNEEPLRTTAEFVNNAINFTMNEVLTRFAVYLSTRSWVSEQELAESFTKLEETEAIGILVSALKVLDERLQGLSLGFIDGRPVIRGHLQGQQLLPLYFLGDGAVHLANITLSIASARDGTVMIDELENGFYYKNLQSGWEAIRRACALSKAQIFATTHSRECVMAALRAFGDDARDQFRLFRLENMGDHTRAIAYDVETANAAFALDLEVR